MKNDKGVNFLKTQGNFMSAPNYSNYTLNGAKFSFLNQMPFLKIKKKTKDSSSS
jgi:hypothetical protein